MIVYMRDDLSRGGAIVLHHVPVVHARRATQRPGEDAHGGAQAAGLGGRGVCELRPVDARAHEEVAAAEGHNVEEGDEGGRGEDDKGRGRREGRLEVGRGRLRREGRVVLDNGAEGAGDGVSVLHGCLYKSRGGMCLLPLSRLRKEFNLVRIF